jgi:O-antigen ligase
MTNQAITTINHKPKQLWYESIITFLCVFSLMFSFTNYTYLSAISVISVVFVPFILIDNNFKVNKFSKSLIILLVYFFISALIVNPRQVFSFDFYRRDGNVFITMIPLVVLSMCSIKFDIWTIIQCFAVISSAANLVAMLKYFVTRPSEYWMLFTGHNSAGGFLAMLCAVNLFLIVHNNEGIKKEKGKWRLSSYFWAICLLLNLFGLYLTNSRGSLLPLAVALVYLLCNRYIKDFDIVVNFLIMICFFIVVGYIAAVRAEDTLVNTSGYILPEEFANNSLMNLALNTVHRFGTVIDRLFYLWPRAMYLFFKSPIFGIGFGGFNDTDYNFIGINYLFNFNFSAVIINSDAHAHNSFLHVLAETGIVGIVLLLKMLFKMRKEILNVKDKNLKRLLFVAFNIAIVSSFFEHRLFTPSEMIPFILIFGMVMSNNCYERRVNNG